MENTVRATIYYNEYFEEEVALFIDGKLVVRGDEYHDKVSEFIDGVLFGIELCGHTVMRASQSINSSNDMFAKCEFEVCYEEGSEEDECEE